MSRSKHCPAIVVAWVLALSGTGAWISGQLVKQHADMWGSAGTTTGFFARICQATERAGFSCAGAMKGRWSQITVPMPLPSRDLTLGVRRVVVPVAFLGLAYFVFMAVWFAFVGRPRPYGYRWHRVPLAAGSCGAAVSLFYLGAVALRFAPACVWCLGVHAINFLMVYAIWRLRPGTHLSGTADRRVSASSSPEEAVRMTLTSRQATSAIAFSLILIAGLWQYRSAHLAFGQQLNKLLPYKSLVTSLQNDSEFLLREHFAQQQREIPPRSGALVAAGRPKLVVFTDFECAECYCNSLAVRRQVTEAFDGQLIVLTRHYPLCSDCNDSVGEKLHQNACEAAYAAEAARLQGGDTAFWQMHDLLFNNREKLGKELYRKLALQIGLDAVLLLSDMEGEEVRQIVESDIELAEELGVTGTPTMFLNGRRVTELCRGPVFWKAFAEAWTSSRGHAQGSVTGIAAGLTESDAGQQQLD